MRGFELAAYGARLRATTEPPVKLARIHRRNSSRSSHAEIRIGLSGMLSSVLALRPRSCTARFPLRHRSPSRTPYVIGSSLHSIPAHHPTVWGELSRFLIPRAAYPDEMPLHFTPNSCAHIRPQGDAEVKARLLDQACGRGIHARPYGAAHPQNVAFSWPQVNVGVRSTFQHTTPLDAVSVCVIAGSITTMSSMLNEPLRLWLTQVEFDSVGTE